MKQPSFVHFPALQPAVLLIACCHSSLAGAPLDKISARSTRAPGQRLTCGRQGLALIIGAATPKKALALGSWKTTACPLQAHSKLQRRSSSTHVGGTTCF